MILENEGILIFRRYLYQVRKQKKQSETPEVGHETVEKASRVRSTNVRIPEVLHKKIQSISDSYVKMSLSSKKIQNLVQENGTDLVQLIASRRADDRMVPRAAEVKIARRER
jgi:hypothetical protein